MSSDNIIYCVQDVHVKELVKRLKWAVTIRWYYIAVSSLLIFIVYLTYPYHGINLHYQLLIAANTFLFFCNLFYQYQLPFHDNRCSGTAELRFSLIFQIMTDYLALMLVVYALGSIETPIMLMIIPNIILATLFFTSRQSLLVTLIGVSLLIMPLYLEYFSLIPRISLFDQLMENSFKTMVLSRPILLAGYTLMIIACVFFCWYLLCSITSRLIKNELELERSYQDMIKLDEEKTNATLRSTHELKAPLAAIKNYVYTMDAGYAGEINEKVSDIINRIGKRCDYLLNNVTDIIKLGNLKSYVVSETQFKAINLRLFLNEFLLQFEPLLQEKKITISLHLNDTIKKTETMILANEEKLQLIFSNLLTNAVHYSHPEGIINIILSHNVTKKNRQQICVTIEDQGIGINKKHLNKIFEEHFRANNAVSFYEGGTGLGLSIVKVCCEILNADIKITSTLSQGTQVLICFKAIE